MKRTEPLQGVRLLEYFVGGEDMRPIPIDDGIKELAYSMVASGMLQPVSAIDYGDYGEPFIGFRRLAALRWGKSESLAVPHDSIPVMLYPPTTTKLAMKIAQITENIARLDVTDIQLYQSVTELAAMGMSLGEIADALGRSKPSACRYFAPDKVPQEAKEAFFAGRLTLGQCYKLSLAVDPLAELAAMLGAAKEKQRKDGPPREKTAKVKIPLAVSNDKYSATGIVTIASLPGGDIDWPSAENLLKEALRSVREAQKEKWTLKSAMETWKAVASPKADGEPLESEDAA